MTLEGRVNLIFEDLGSNQTRVTANTRYGLTKLAEVKNVQGAMQTFSDTISFNSGSSAQFPRNPNASPTECFPNGKLEQDILSAIN